MSGGWLDVQGPGGTRREALREGLTRVGGPGSDVVLAQEVEGELHVWNRPPRAIHLGRGGHPTCAGQPFEERDLRPGDRIEWAGHVLVYGGEAAGGHQAELEELSAPVAPVAPGAAPLVARVRAGLACQLGLADAQAMKRWQQAVLAGRFDADACARELLPGSSGAESEQRLLERSGTLLRDFLMAPYLSGAAGARRKLREQGRSIVAFLVAQGLALLVFGLLVAASLLVARAGGTSIDALLDRILPGQDTRSTPGAPRRTLPASQRG